MKSVAWEIRFTNPESFSIGTVKKEVKKFGPFSSYSQQLQQYLYFCNNLIKTAPEGITTL